MRRIDAFPRRSSSLIPFAVAILLVLAGVTALSAQQTPPVTRQQTLVSNAMKLIDSGKYELARAPLEEARTLAHDAGDVASEAEATRGLGMIRLAAKDAAGARAQFDEALRLSESIRDSRGMGRAHSSLAFLAWTEAKWAEVRRLYRAAADDFGTAGDPAERANALRNMTFDRTMTDAESLDTLRQAWEAVRPLGDARREGLILHQWGDFLTARGDYGDALDKLEAAVTLLNRGGTPVEISYVATSLGRAYRLHGLPEQALPYFQQALAIQERAGDQRAVAQTLGALALVYSQLGRDVEALDFATRALESARRSSERSMVFNAIGHLAETELDLRRYTDAIALLEAALKDPDDPALTLAESTLHGSLAAAYAGVGRLDAAAREADRAVALSESSDRPEDLLWNLEQRARVRLARQDSSGAFADTDRALARIERLRTTLPPRDFLRRGFADTYQSLFTLAMDVNMQRHDGAGALMVAEQARARAFQDLLATHAPSATPGDGGPVDALVSAASVGAPGLDELKAVVARLRSPLVAYWVAPHETFIWVVTVSGAVDVRTVTVDAARLETLARAVSTGPDGTTTRGAVAPASAQTNATSSSRTAGGGELRELYDLLIKPVRDVLRSERATRLTIIPHGPLFRVSFASLADERGRYLIERSELHYAPAVGVLRFTEQHRHTTGIRRALLVADPDLPKPTSGTALPPLAGARLEVSAAARLLGIQADVLTGPQATEARVRGSLSGRDVLHFATHGIVMDNEPLGSYLAFARSGSEAATDGHLTAAEIYSLDISADLVVLSACRSGAGKVTGDGIIGLTRGFFYAGAPSVLATLWDLADEPAQFLMRRFYTHWRQGTTKAAALRAAQLDLIRALRAGTITAQTAFGPVKLTERPALWASFVLLGEP